MTQITKIAINEKDLIFVKNTLRKYLPEAKIILFGSRVNGDSKKYSDLDIAIKDKQKIDLLTISYLKEDFANSDLHFMIDLLDYHRASDEFKEFLDTQQHFL